MNRAQSFTIGSGLGFAYEVFKTRPKSTISLLLISLLLSVGYMLASTLPMGLWGAPLSSALQSGDMVSFTRLNSLISLSHLLVSIFGVLAYVWLETVWLVFVLKGQSSFKPGWAVMGRVFLSFLVVYAVYLGTLFVTIVLAVIFITVLIVVGGDAGAMVSAGMIGLVALIILIAIMLRFSAVPAYVVLKGKFLLSTPISVAGRRWGTLLTAWLIWSVIYLLVIAIGWAIAFIIPGGFGQMVWDTVRQFDDPFVHYTVYAEAFSSASALAMFTLSIIPLSVLPLPMLLIARGLGAKLALAIEAEEQKGAVEEITG